MGTAKKITLEDAWDIVTELAISQKETGLQLKGLRKSQEETGLQLKGLGKSQEKRLIANLKRLTASLKKLLSSSKKLIVVFNSQWGKLVESLVEGNIAQKFADRGVQVQGTTQRAKKTFEDKQYEFDIIVHNGDEIIVVEVKTTLDVGKVKHFLEKLKCFKKLFPEYANKKVYGAVAFIVADSGSDQYSENQKIFVIKATGDSASIINSQNFKPRDF